MHFPPLIVLARMDSTRLPGKALLDVAGRPLLSRVIERLRVDPAALDADLSSHQTIGQALEPGLGGRSRIVIATTDRRVDDPIAELANDEGVGVHRTARNADDVAGRFLDAAAEAGGATAPDWAFRVNGDSPLTDASLLYSAVENVRDGVDLVTNLRPRRFPYGVAVELIRASALSSFLTDTCADPDNDTAAADREHVTRGLYRELAYDRVVSVSGGDSAWAELRATVDTQGDLDRFRAFIEAERGRWPITPLRAVVSWARGGSPA